MSLLTVTNLRKTYSNRSGSQTIQALANVTFTVDSGEYLAIMGESGSGKTTLLNMIAAIDRPTSGEVRLDDQVVSTLKDQEIALFRRENLGFVFQDYQLLDAFSVQDNILLPLVFRGMTYVAMLEKLNIIAQKLDLADVLSRYPHEISGGQKQRTAIARALITNPKLILADEPTGALDSRSTEQLLNIFRALNDDGQTVLMATHSVRVASHASRVLFIKDGLVYHQIYRGQNSNEQMYAKILQTLTMIASSGMHHE
ncbi:MAG: ABC transporter ATP-binding protein [Chloroflexota bacterium]|jgi:putative ABC transport system ATP-binding protein